MKKLRATMKEKLQNIIDKDEYYSHLRNKWIWLGDMSYEYVHVYKFVLWFKSLFKRYEFE